MSCAHSQISIPQVASAASYPLNCGSGEALIPTLAFHRSSRQEALCKLKAHAAQQGLSYRQMSCQQATRLGLMPVEGCAGVVYIGMSSQVTACRQVEHLNVLKLWNACQQHLACRSFKRLEIYGSPAYCRTEISLLCNQWGFCGVPTNTFPATTSIGPSSFFEKHLPPTMQMGYGWSSDHEKVLSSISLDGIA